ncbi:sorbosone dehydrogenase [Lysobacter helvus]|uniref:Sorbosone dehydrogenase n=3 Tax=Lysobacterales TaxID=135614 RepID=A0ABM7Q5J6_9GAMM|nr:MULTISPECIES: sorbosone dehydrogenase family protein [Lysobacter]BCT92542.1 sorbosone dehydrogenase [Lysobacter caseinilyticus]BCT95695.1 sorbosone dehydrogenase [Lysobacter helvus]
MRMRLAFSGLSVAIAALLAAACAPSAKLTTAQTSGPTPVIPAPDKALVPTVKIAPATGWPAGTMPTAAQGLQVQAFATGLTHPRWLYVLPNGDVLVAETNRPATEDPSGNPIRDALMNQAFEKAGAAVPSPERISLLRDTDGDGVAETKTTFLQHLTSPFGMALVGGTFYVANADSIVHVPYKAGETTITATPVKLADLPGAPRNHHWTKSLLANADGTKLYVGVGSNSNAAEHGMDIEFERAAIHEIDLGTGKGRVFASGLRNPVGLDWNPQTKALWVVVNERDELGSDLVPDYLTSVQDGAFYGWPWSYYGAHVDTRVEPARPDMVAKAIAPDYALGPHVASLGLAFYTGTALPAHYRDGAFVGLHGSWNRDPQSGYKVIFVPFANGKPAGAEEDVLTGFLDAQGNARGRPVGVVVAKDGAVLVADDVGNTIWRITPAH